MTFADDKKLLERVKAGELSTDAPEWRELQRRHAAAVDLQVDVLLERLAAVPGPAPGYQSRRASDQRQYDEILAELERYRSLQDDHTEIQLRYLENDLTDSAQRADEAADTFTRKLESFQNG